MIYAALSLSAKAQTTLKVAVWHGDFSREGPGLLLKDLTSGRDTQTEAALAYLVSLSADLVVLTRFDHDLYNVALRQLATRLAAKGLDYRHLFAPAQNRGLASGLDLDGDGHLGRAEDAQGYGRFSGDGAMAVLSRYPVHMVADYSQFLWRDLPNTQLGPVPAAVADVQRLSSSAHWVLRVDLPQQGALHLLSWSATPPIFGRGLRNQARNHDETAFWDMLLSGQLGLPVPPSPFILAGHPNLAEGQGQPAALRALEHNPALGPIVRAASAKIAGNPAQLSMLAASPNVNFGSSGAYNLQESVHSALWAEILLPFRGLNSAP